MRFQARLFIASLFLVPAGGSASFRAGAQDLRTPNALPRVNSQQEKVEALSRLWSEVKYNFVNIDRIAFDIDSLYRVSLDRVMQTTDDLQFYQELRRFIASFGDGHTELLGRNGYRPYREDDYLNNWPVWLSAIGRHIYCTKVRDDYRHMLGAEILSVEDIPVAEYMERYVLPLSPGSVEESRWNYGAALLGRGYIGLAQDVSYRTPQGDVKSEILTFSHLASMRDGQQWITFEAHPVFNTEYPVGLRWRNGIAVVNIDTFNDIYKPELIAKIDSVMERLRGKARGLILDLRRNSGGSSLVADHVQMYIDPSDSIRTPGWQTRINSGYGRAQGNYRKEYADFFDFTAYENHPSQKVPRNPEIKALTCPTVILIGNSTGSAAEDLLVGIYELPDRPLLVGSPSNGSTGAPLVIELPHGAYARICTRRLSFPFSGKSFVGAIEPDIRCENDINDLLTGHDRTLEKGLELIQQKQTARP